MKGVIDLGSHRIEKWWKVKRGIPLTDSQKAKAVDFLMAWVERRMSAS